RICTLAKKTQPIKKHLPCQQTQLPQQLTQPKQEDPHKKLLFNQEDPTSQNLLTRRPNPCKTHKKSTKKTNSSQEDQLLRRSPPRTNSLTRRLTSDVPNSKINLIRDPTFSQEES
ncbi:hypothetical protein AVEN_228692-1, partial [Araneus ventricosus]